MQKLSSCTALVAVALVSGSTATSPHSGVAARASARPSITVRVDDKRIASPPRGPAGYVDVHIVTAGRVHHHLSFWHLNQGVTVKRFLRALNSPKGPFRLATAVGGNGPMLAGRLETTMHLAVGTVVLADIVEAPTTRIASFRVAGPPVSARPPTAIGTIVNRGFRFVLPAAFGRPGVYRFTNSDPVAHDGVIYRLREGRTAADLVRWFRRGGIGIAPVVFARPLGGPGVIGAHWASWFTLPRLAPGRYILACFLPDERGVLHVAMGMVAQFEVRPRPPGPPSSKSHQPTKEERS
jgi:hypothetical protein